MLPHSEMYNTQKAPATQRGQYDDSVILPRERDTLGR